MLISHIHEISLPSVTPNDRDIAAKKLVTLFERLTDTNGIPAVKPVLGHTGYIDRKIEIPAASTYGLEGKHVAVGLDQYRRKAIYCRVRKTRGDWVVEGQICWFERHAPTSGVWVEGTPDSLSLLSAEASPKDADAITELIETGSTTVSYIQYDDTVVESKFELI